MITNVDFRKCIQNKELPFGEMIRKDKLVSLDFD